MSLAAASSIAVPLKTDADGVIRVGGTRVRLDTMVFAYNEGATPEEIVEPYPSLKLSDVHVVIGYYLQNRDEVEHYLHKRQEQRKQVRRMNEARLDPNGIRDRLLARQ
jgi:uncharacterized protein (DUF433 family)